MIEQATLEKAKAFVLANWDKIDNRWDSKAPSDPSFHFYGAKHCTVFSHPEFPGYVLKVMNKFQSRETKEGVDFAHKVFTEQGFLYCHTPAAAEIDLTDTKTLLLMEKAAGNTDEFAAKEEMEKEFELIDSDPEMAAKWKQMTREVALATAKIGYWDSQRKNLIWDSQKGWSFIDFERIGPSRDNKKTGLDRLVEIFPPQFVDEIYDVADAHGVRLDMTREVAKVHRQTQFNFSRELSRWSLEKGVPRVLDKERWDSSTWERKILDHFDENRNAPWYQDYPPAQIELNWQPFTFSLTWEQSQNYKELGEPIYLKNRAEFELALENLKAAGVVRTWKVEEQHAGTQPYLVSYTIYF